MTVDPPKVRANSGTVRVTGDDGVDVTHTAGEGDDEPVTGHYNVAILYPGGWLYAADDGGSALMLPESAVERIVPCNEPEADADEGAADDVGESTDADTDDEADRIERMGEAAAARTGGPDG